MTPIYIEKCISVLKHVVLTWSGLIAEFYCIYMYIVSVNNYNSTKRLTSIYI